MGCVLSGYFEPESLTPRGKALAASFRDSGVRTGAEKGKGDALGHEGKRVHDAGQDSPGPEKRPGGGSVPQSPGKGAKDGAKGGFRHESSRKKAAPGHTKGDNEGESAQDKDVDSGAWRKGRAREVAEESSVAAEASAGRKKGRREEPDSGDKEKDKDKDKDRAKAEQKRTTKGEAPPARRATHFRAASLNDRVREPDGSGGDEQLEAESGVVSGVAPEESLPSSATAPDQGVHGTAKSRNMSGSLLGSGMKKKHKQAREERGRSVTTTAANSSSKGTSGPSFSGSGSLSARTYGSSGEKVIIGKRAAEGGSKGSFSSRERGDLEKPKLVVDDFDASWLNEPLIKCSDFLGSRGKIEVMGFEVANVILRSIRLRQQLQDRDLDALRKDVIMSEGIQTLVSANFDFVWSIAGRDKREELRAICRDVVRMGRMACNPQLHRLPAKLNSLGRERDRHWKSVTPDQAEKVFQRLESRARATADLYHEISSLENMQKALSKRLKEPKSAIQEIVNHMKSELKNQEAKVKEKRQSGLWDQSMDRVVPDLVVVLIVLHFRIVDTFGEFVLEDGPLVPVTLEDEMRWGRGGEDSTPWPGTPGATTPQNYPLSPVGGPPQGGGFPPSLSVAAVIAAGVSEGGKVPVFAGDIKVAQAPTMKPPPPPLLRPPTPPGRGAGGGGASPSPRARPELGVPASVSAKDLSLGETGMALHYANIVAMVDKMVLRSNMYQHREALYTALPRAVRQRLKKDLLSSSHVEELSTEEIKQRLASRLDWLSTMAENTIKLGVDRRLQGHTDVTILETLHHAREGKMQALLVELIVNLQHLCSRQAAAQSLDDLDDDLDFGDDQLLLLSLQQQEQSQPPADWKPVPQFAIVAPMVDISIRSRHAEAAATNAAATSEEGDGSQVTEDGAVEAAGAPLSLGRAGEEEGSILSRLPASSSSIPSSASGDARLAAPSSLAAAAAIAAVGAAVPGGGIAGIPGSSSFVSISGASSCGSSAHLGPETSTGSPAAAPLPMEKAHSFPLAQFDLLGPSGSGPSPLGPMVGSRGDPRSAGALEFVPEEGGEGKEDEIGALPPSKRDPLPRRMRPYGSASQSAPLNHLSMSEHFNNHRRNNWRGHTLSVRQRQQASGAYLRSRGGIHSLEFPRAKTLAPLDKHALLAAVAEDEDAAVGAPSGRRTPGGGAVFAAWSEAAAQTRGEFEERFRENALSRRPLGKPTLSREKKQRRSAKFDSDPGGFTLGAHAEGGLQALEGSTSCGDRNRGSRGENHSEDLQINVERVHVMMEEDVDDELIPDIPAMTPRSLDVDRIGDDFFDDDEGPMGGEPMFRVSSE